MRVANMLQKGCARSLQMATVIVFENLQGQRKALFLQALLKEIMRRKSANTIGGQDGIHKDNRRGV